MRDPLLAELSASRIVPVVTFSDLSRVDAVIDGLVRGGISCVEVTLRTRFGIPAIERIAARADILVGSGTVLDVGSLTAAARAGAHFAVSPGLDAEFVDAARSHGMLPLPGVATPTEMLRARALGVNAMKVFPAALLGGLPYLDAVHATYPDLSFLPSGGIRQDSARDYLCHPGVFAVGASWLIPDEDRDDLPEEVARRSRATLAEIEGNGLDA